MSESYYIEVQDATLEHIINFSNYMLDERTIKIIDGNYELNTCKQPELGEEFAPILFVRTNPSKPQYIYSSEYPGLHPPPLMRLQDCEFVDGKWSEPVFNLESKLEALYSNGLFDGNPYYLYDFASTIRFIIDKQIKIDTWISNGMRKFKLTNTLGSKPDFYNPSS